MMDQNLQGSGDQKKEEPFRTNHLCNILDSLFVFIPIKICLFIFHLSCGFTKGGNISDINYLRGFFFTSPKPGILTWFGGLLHSPYCKVKLRYYGNFTEIYIFDHKNTLSSVAVWVWNLFYKLLGQVWLFPVYVLTYWAFAIYSHVFCF